MSAEKNFTLLKPSRDLMSSKKGLSRIASGVNLQSMRSRSLLTDYLEKVVSEQRKQKESSYGDS